jgi:hypothetical protein
MVVRRLKGIVSGATRPHWKSQSREVHEFRRVFKDNFVTLIVSAFGVVAALSWNEFLKQIIFDLFPEKGTLIVKGYSAIAITLVSVFVTYLLSKLKSK